MKVALVAGEASGDLLGAGLIRALRKIRPDATFEGVAGPEMVAAGCDSLEPAESLAVMGLIEPLREIPRLLRLRRRLIQRWTTEPPDVFVGIDAPDFNLGLEDRLRRSQIRTVHYVSPSVWAWRQGRIKKIARAVDTVLCLLPFEKRFYAEQGVKAVFVGHPMAERLPENPDAEEARRRAGIHGRPVVAILPGSRMSEVSRLGPLFAATASRLSATYPDIEFIAPMATTRIAAAFTAHCDEAGVDKISLLDGDAETAIAAADVVMLASGTATLQTALLGRPMVVAYQLAALTYGIAKGMGLVKVPHIALPNLLTEKPMVPEFIQSEATPAALGDAVGDLLNDPQRRNQITAEFQILRTTLARDADQRAAEAVLALVQS